MLEIGVVPGPFCSKNAPSRSPVRTADAPDPSLLTRLRCTRRARLPSAAGCARSLRSFARVSASAQRPQRLAWSRNSRTPQSCRAPVTHLAASRGPLLSVHGKARALRPLFAGHRDTGVPGRATPPPSTGGAPSEIGHQRAAGPASAHPSGICARFRSGAACAPPPAARVPRLGEEIPARGQEKKRAVRDSGCRSGTTAGRPWSQPDGPCQPGQRAPRGRALVPAYTAFRPRISSMRRS